jgi:hypothetical protein
VRTISSIARSRDRLTQLEENMRYPAQTSTRRRLQLKGLLLTATLLLPAAWSRGAAADTLRGVETPFDALANTAAIVEGSVKDVTYTMDEKAGPRTVAMLTDVRADFGNYDSSSLALATLGGPVSEKKELFIPELPRLTEDTRYLVFLTNGDWFYTPLVEDYVFRLETGPRGTEILIAPSGQAVMGLSAEKGLELSEDPVVDTQLDFARPHAQLRLLDEASPVLAAALSKEDFLIAVSGLLRTVPLQGAFRSSPSRDRIWNRLPTEEAPLRNANRH